MKYQVIKDFTLKLNETQQILSLKAGQIIIMEPETANKLKLIESGRIKEICYWQDRVIEDCQKPCVAWKEKTLLRECPYFGEYFQKERRLRGIQRGYNESPLSRGEEFSDRGAKTSPEPFGEATGQTFKMKEMDR